MKIKSKHYIPIKWVYLISCIVFILHCLTNHNYGFHRDELYMIDCGNNLAFGYFDMPPLVPFLGKITTSIFGTNLFGLRILPAVIHSLLIILTANITKQLGGKSKAQIIAAIAIAVSPVLLVAGNQFQTIPFDQLFWAILIAIFTKIATSNRPIYWLPFGIFAGLAFISKYLILVLIFSIGLTIILVRKWNLLKSKYFLMGISLAFLIALPNLIWQFSHNFPFLEHVQALRGDLGDEFTVIGFLKEQFLVLHPINFILIILGTIYFFLIEKKQWLFGLVFYIVLITFIITKAKTYYLASAIPIMLAGAAVFFEKLSIGLKRNWIYKTVTISLILPTIISIPLWLPILPINKAKEIGIIDFRGDYQEMIGWEYLALQVANVYHSLELNEKANALIIAGNYGEAGAINLYGDSLNLPDAACGMPTYHNWGYSPKNPQVFIFVGYPQEWLLQYFESAETKATIQNPYMIENEELGQSIVLCYDTKMPFEEIWEQLRHN